VHGIDVETAGNNGGGALTPEEGRLRLVQISDGLRTDIYDAFLDDAEVIRKAVAARGELAAHNAVFERMWLKHALGIDRPDLHDTMIMSQVLTGGTRTMLNKSSGHSLQAVAKRVLKEDIDKGQQTSDWGALALTREQLEYAAKDAKVMPKLADALMSRIDRAGLRKVYELERRVAFAVDAMERRGVAIHTDRLDAMTEDATERAERLKAELEAEWGINPGSSKQLREHFGLDERKEWPCARIASDGRGAGEGRATIRYRRDSGGHTTPLVGVPAVSLGPNNDDRRVTTIDNQETFLVCKWIIYPTEGMRLGLDGAMMLVLCDGLGVGGSHLSSSTH
jgi:ribonuclease D